MKRLSNLIFALSCAPLLIVYGCGEHGDECDCWLPGADNLPCTYVNHTSDPLLLLWEHYGHEYFARLDMGSTVRVDLFDAHGTDRHEALGVAPTELQVEAGDTLICLMSSTLAGGYCSHWLDHVYNNGLTAANSARSTYTFTDSVLVALCQEAREAQKGDIESHRRCAQQHHKR